MFVIDHHGQILFANRASERLFGWSATELLGRDVNMLMPEPERSAHPACLARFRATGEARVIGKGRDVQAQRRDGRCFPARLSVGKVEGTDPPEFVGFVHDLSDRVREAEDARRLNDRLMQVTRMATMGEMATGIAHEVNQPLTAITNYALAANRFLAVPEPELGEVREALQEIAAEAQRAGEIIRRMRRMARGNDGGEREDTRPEELLEELRLLCVADARANDTRLRFDVQPGLPRVVIHRVQIAQALLNLVRNALESVAGNSPGEREVIVQARATPTGDCEFAVCDNGAGVLPEVAARLFEPFLSTKRHGTGLGLPMSQTIAQAHGGSLRHEPWPPRGARFVLALPAAEAAS